VRTSPRSARRLALVAAGAALLTAGCERREAYEKTFGLGWPSPKTIQAESMYDTWLGSVAAAAVVGLLMYILIAVTVIRDRKKSDELPPQIRYNLPIEILYTVVPFVIIGVLFYYTAVSENKVNKLTKDPDVHIGVVGFQWNWQFNYLDEKVQVTGEPPRGATLYLPVNERIRFTETSPDVIHSFWVPDFLFKRDVIPGHPNSFEVSSIDEPGAYVGRCAELCGTYHANMNFEVRAVSWEKYQRYIQERKDGSSLQDALRAIGEKPEASTTHPFDTARTARRGS
jgi:cytochrome c oxidase subunit 2